MSYRSAMKKNMASAERDLKTDADRRGFVIGAVLAIWEEYQKGKIDAGTFHELANYLKTFDGGKFDSFIAELVRAYTSGNPPVIIAVDDRKCSYCGGTKDLGILKTLNGDVLCCQSCAERQGV